jgi:hypothetical protein
MTPAPVIRAPSKHTYSIKPPSDNGSVEVEAPSFLWIGTTWCVAYTNLPLWKDKKNVRITYRIEGNAPSPSDGRMPDLDDHVVYEEIGKTKEKHIHGISRPVEVEGIAFGLAYSWRGKGWLRIASSDWEILGWGKDEFASADKPNDWVVTCFSKTLFTPAGIDIYTRTALPLTEETLKKIKDVLTGLADENWSKMVNAIYEISRA